MRRRQNQDLFREITRETMLGFTYTDKEDDLWVKHPSGGWLCVGKPDEDDLEPEWDNPRPLWPKTAVVREWGPLVEKFLIIHEQP